MKGYKESPERWECRQNDHCLLVLSEAEADRHEERTRPRAVARDETHWWPVSSYEPVCFPWWSLSLMPAERAPDSPSQWDWYGGTWKLQRDGVTALRCAGGMGTFLWIPAESTTCWLCFPAAMQRWGAGNPLQPSALPCLFSQTDGVSNLQTLDWTERIC